MVRLPLIFFSDSAGCGVLIRIQSYNHSFIVSLNQILSASSPAGDRQLHISDLRRHLRPCRGSSGAAA